MGKRNLSDKKTATQLAHAGHNPFDYFGFVNPPVVHASTVLYPDYETLISRKQPYTYGTSGTPTTVALENAINLLEGSDGTILLPSGLAAITIPLLTFAKAGSHCLIVDSIYGPTRKFADTMLSRLGVSVEYFDPLIGDEFPKLLCDNTSIVMLESPASNTFEMLDVPKICDQSHAVGAIVMLDNTWATPLFFKPLDYGVDVSIHALTKYPSGGADLVMGSASASGQTFESLREGMLETGVCVQGDDCATVLRGLRSMELRLHHHQKSAMEIIHWLQAHSQVSRILYPALPDDPGHSLWKRDFKGASGLFSFVLKGASEPQLAAFLDALELFGMGYSWAGFESLAVPVYLSDRTIATGPEDGPLIRLQIGLEDTQDLINDLKKGFEASKQA